MSYPVNLQPFIKGSYKHIRFPDSMFIEQPATDQSVDTIVEDMYLSTPVFIGNKCLILVTTHWFLDTMLFIKEKGAWKQVEKTFGYPIHGWVS